MRRGVYGCYHGISWGEDIRLQTRINMENILKYINTKTHTYLFDYLYISISIFFAGIYFDVGTCIYIQWYERVCHGISILYEMSMCLCLCFPGLLLYPKKTAWVKCGAGMVWELNGGDHHHKRSKEYVVVDTVATGHRSTRSLVLTIFHLSTRLHDSGWLVARFLAVSISRSKLTLMNSL